MFKIENQNHMLIFRVPESISDSVAQLVTNGQQSVVVDSAGTNNKSAGGASASNPASASSSSSSSSLNNPGTDADGLSKNKIVLDVKPDLEGNRRSHCTTRYLVTLQGKAYPALLMNLPTPIEAQKIFERHNVLKSGDIGQMLQVFRTEEELLEAKAQIKNNAKPGMSDNDIYMGSSMPSGLTSATDNIHKNRYELTRRSTAPPIETVKQVTEEISKAIKGQNVKQTITSNAAAFFVDTESGGGDIRAFQTVEEDVVDFAQWMADDDNPDGVKIIIRRKNEWAEDEDDGDTNFELAQKYPELVLGAIADSTTGRGATSTSAGTFR